MFINNHDTLYFLNFKNFNRKNVDLNVNQTNNTSIAHKSYFATMWQRYFLFTLYQTIGTDKISITDKYGVSRNINMYQTQLKISCEMQSTVATWEIRRE